MKGGSTGTIFISSTIEKFRFKLYKEDYNAVVKAILKAYDEKELSYNLLMPL
ncbi:TPA: hypothetical protein ACKOR7_002063 [Clostridioides difficile]